MTRVLDEDSELEEEQQEKVIGDIETTTTNQVF